VAELVFVENLIDFGNSQVNLDHNFHISNRFGNGPSSLYQLTG